MLAEQQLTKEMKSMSNKSHTRIRNKSNSTKDKLTTSYWWWARSAPAIISWPKWGTTQSGGILFFF
jgi:hypothetical protein